MGITTCAIIENRLRGDELGGIADRLNADSRLAALMREYDGALRSDWPQLRAELCAEPWQLECLRNSQDLHASEVESDRDPRCECRGPFGTLYLYENLAELSWYFCRWSVFLTEARFRNPLYEATRIVAALLNGGGGSTGVFVPDSSYDESLALDELHGRMPELLASLSGKCGPPAESLEAIAREPFKGYYVTRWLGAALQGGGG
jgi:hypothetical protein